ncbi:MAG: hypothetical protein M3Y49_03445 [Actinomycetota bacterium]|nr:hypothetical protein [Actinomycetota bacterium]
MQIQQLREQIVSIMKVISPVAELEERLMNPPAMKAASQIREVATHTAGLRLDPAIRQAHMQAFASLQEVTKQYQVLLDSPEMKLMAEAVQSAAAHDQQLLNHFAQAGAAPAVITSEMAAPTSTPPST